VARDVGRACHRDLRDRAEAAQDHPAVVELAGADDAIDSLAHQIDQAVALPDLQFELRIARQKCRQMRQDEGTGQQRMCVDAQQTARPRVAHRGFRLLDLRQNGDAAAIIILAVERRRDVPRGALEQARAEMRLEPAQHLARRRAGNAEIGRRSRKALPFDEADEQAHGVKSVHGRLFTTADK